MKRSERRKDIAQMIQRDPGLNRYAADPVSFMRTVRKWHRSHGTSFDPGYTVPFYYAPVLREDSVTKGRCTAAVKMQEVVEILRTGVMCTVEFHFVPYTAFDKFEGSTEQVNKSYMGQPAYSGGPVTPFFDPFAPAWVGNNAVFQKAGLHAAPGDTVNLAYVQAYNQILNYKRASVSQSITQRGETALTLGECMWSMGDLARIVPDFDQAAISGAVELDIVSPDIPVDGIGVHPSELPSLEAGEQILESNGSSRTTNWQTDTQANFGWKTVMETNAAGVPQVFVDMQNAGLSLTLGNFDKAREMRSFAKLRETFRGHSDDYIIDLLMQGVRVPEAHKAQPLLLARKSGLIGYNTRYSTTSGSLDEHVTEGAGIFDVNIRMPQTDVGGIIVGTVECVPERVFERLQDPFFTATDVNELPNALYDSMDTEKVDVVLNERIDVLHSAPDGRFGYEPMNARWDRDDFLLGGKFYRPQVDVFSQDRSQFWTYEKTDPVISDSWFLAKEVQKGSFADALADAFEIEHRTMVFFEGNTQFGPQLTEGSDEYTVLQTETDRPLITK